MSNPLAGRIGTWTACMLMVIALQCPGAIYDSGGFESPAFTAGPVNGQNGWFCYGDSNQTVIQTAQKYAGSQALRLKNCDSRVIARKLQDPGTNDFYVTFRMFPADAVEILGNFSFILRDSGGTILLSVTFNGSGTINGTANTAYNFGQWNFISVHVKGGTNKWDLYVNGVLTDKDLAFVNAPGAGRHLGWLDFDWRGNAAYNTDADGVFIDNLIVDAPDDGDVYLSGGFETFSVGTINGQDGWFTYGTATDSEVQTVVAFEGTKALRLKNSGNRTIARKITDPGCNDFFIDFRVFPADAAEILTNFNFVLRDSAGTILFTVPFNSAGGISGVTGATYNFGEWNQIAIHIKGATQKWDLYVNSVLMAEDLAFSNAPGAGRHLGWYDLDWRGNAAYNSSTDGVFIDNFEVTVPVYADTVPPGWDAADATACLQNAIDTGARRVIVRNGPGGSPWYVRPMALTSDQTLLFSDGTLVMAKANEFHGTSDMLFKAYNKQNIVLSGYGATLRMRKSDYQNPALYTPSESRMATAFYGCRNVLIEGLNIEDSGGDGIYLTSCNTTVNACRDVVIRDVVCDNNHRQGISVISVDGLAIDNCVFSNTSGAAPQAGIDLEPNNSWEKLKGIVVRDCDFLYNGGTGILLAISNLTGDSDDIDVLFDNCTMDAAGNTRYGVEFGRVLDGGLGGTVTFQDCTFANSYDSGVRMQNVSGDPGTLAITFDHCDFVDMAWYQSYPIYFKHDSSVTGIAHVGGVSFINGCTVVDTKNRPAVAANSTIIAEGLRGVHGTIIVDNPYGAIPLTNYIGTNGIDVDITVVEP